MARYRRETVVDAPLSRVWEFHSTVDGLLALTPDWLGLSVERVRGPDGELDPTTLAEGSEISLSTRAFGIGPKQSWTSHIVERERSDDRAWFRDTMDDGPFQRWDHTHLFEQADGGTRIVDRIEYELPPGAVGRTVSPIAVVGLEPMFRYRHRRTKALLE